MAMNRPRILVTGVTGYIGGTLVPRLLGEGYPVRVLVRDAARLEGNSWRDQVQVAGGDVLNRPESLPAALDQIDVAYYFIHSLRASSGFHELDMSAARNFASAARAAGVQRIIYLGGLGDPQDRLSEHLYSRQRTGAALREAGVPVTEFRAAIIIGSGSGSFEMIRYLTDRIPFLISPRWVFSQIQPIAIDDVIDYLVAALRVPESAGEIIEIGGPTILSYGGTMLTYARARNLRRYIIPVPVLSPSISSHWVGWVTPLSAAIARPLIEGLRNNVVVRDDKAQELFPDIHPLDYPTAVDRALSALGPDILDTAWLDAQVAQRGDENPVVVLRQEGLYIQRRYHRVDASPEDVYRVFTGLGGDHGWLHANWLWRLRGLADLLLGGIGFRRGRRHPDALAVGDAVDFMRVELLQPGRLARLKIETKMPGQLWLQYEAHPLPEGRAQLVQTIFVDAKGLLGLLYWYLTYPVHTKLFGGLVREIAHRAESPDPFERENSRRTIRSRLLGLFRREEQPL
jgi:uncharacterized protein YbjT (DUF2867 family)